LEEEVFHTVEHNKATQRFLILQAPLAYGNFPVVHVIKNVRAGTNSHCRSWPYNPKYEDNTQPTHAKKGQNYPKKRTAGRPKQPFFSPGVTAVCFPQQKKSKKQSREGQPDTSGRAT
jgi:hypothetical protein